MTINARAFIPTLINVVLRRPVSISNMPSKATIIEDGLTHAAVDVLLQPPETPSFTIAPPSAHAPAAHVVETPTIQTSDPLIAREAAGIGIPVVPSPDPLTPEDVAAATEGHRHTMDAQSIEKEAAKFAVPLISAALDKVSDAEILAFAAKENHTLGGLAVKAVESVVDGNAKGLFGSLAPVIDAAVASNEPAFERLIASKEAAIVALARAYIKSELAKAEAFANS